MEPLSVGIHSVSTIAQLRANQSIAIFGAGPVGLLCMAVAKALGASRIVAIDIVQSRLDFAKEYAATDTFLPPKPNEGESKKDYSQRVAAEIKQTLGIEERGPSALDVVLDASGAEVCIQMAFLIAKAGGTLVQVSYHATYRRPPLVFSNCGIGWHGAGGCADSDYTHARKGAERQGLVPIWSTSRVD